MNAPNENGPRKRSVVGNVAAVGGLLMLAALLYVLSYPVVVRIRYGRQPPLSYQLGDGNWELYRPVEWLIAETPLREPLFWWAGVWGVGEAVEMRHEMR